jgi:hypothetical protein
VERDARDLEAESARDEGLPEPEPRIEDVEPIHLLANEARPMLAGEGFTDEQILSWAEAFFAQHREGDAHELVAWIRSQQKTR